MSEVAVADNKRTWLRNPSLRIGAIGSLLFLVLSFLSIAWTPHAVDNINVGAALQDPGLSYWLGTDHLGRDVLSMLMKGTLTSFVVAGVAVVIGAALGVPLGYAAALWGGAVDWFVLRMGNFLVAFPALVIAMLLATVFGASAVVIMIAVGVFNIPAFARVTRDAMLTLKSLDYVAAARLAGMSGLDAARRHVFPAIAKVIFVQVILQLAIGILAEASLSYVGLGAQSPVASLGLMLKDAQAFALLKPLLAVFPGVALVLVVIALNLAADGLRDQLDGNLRRLKVTHGAT